MTHATVPVEEQAQRGIHAGGVRLSIGLEDVSDIIADLGQGLDVALSEWETADTAAGIEAER